MSGISVLTKEGMKEMQIKITLRFHLIPVKIVIIKNITSNKNW
jgi:hypothetical protein